MSVCGEPPSHLTLTARQTAAVEAVRRAVDSRGLRVRLCKELDVDDVLAKMLYLAASLQVGNVHFGENLRESKLAEANTAKNVCLLAELLEAHLEASA